MVTKKSLTFAQSSLPEAYCARCWPSWSLKSWLGKVGKTHLTGVRSLLLMAAETSLPSGSEGASSAYAL